MNLSKNISNSCRRFQKVPIKLRNIVLEPLAQEEIKQLEKDYKGLIGENHKKTMQKKLIHGLPEALSQRSSPKIKILSPISNYSRKIPKFSIKVTHAQSSDTEPIPPYIKKLEKFMIKLEKIAKTKSYLTEATNKCQSPRVFKPYKEKKTGVPARFQKVQQMRNSVSHKNFKQEDYRNKRDLVVVKSNEGSELKQRLEIAKLARRYEERFNKDGVLKNPELEDSWRWFTPGNTPIPRTVHFEND